MSRTSVDKRPFSRNPYRTQRLLGQEDGADLCLEMVHTVQMCVVRAVSCKVIWRMRFEGFLDLPMGVLGSKDCMMSQLGSPCVTPETGWCLRRVGCKHNTLRYGQVLVRAWRCSSPAPWSTPARKILA